MCIGRLEPPYAEDLNMRKVSAKFEPKLLTHQMIHLIRKLQQIKIWKFYDRIQSKTHTTQEQYDVQEKLKHSDYNKQPSGSDRMVDVATVGDSICQSCVVAKKLKGKYETLCQTEFT